MPIPDFQTLMLPVLRLSEAGEIKAREAVDHIADKFSLTEQERKELLPSTKRKTRIMNRVYWAITYLVKSGLLERPRRGYFTITSEGRTVLASEPERIDMAFLAQFDDFRKFRSQTDEDYPPEVESSKNLTVGTPEERVEEAFEDLNDLLREDLLKRILQMSPAAFERLIIDLMLGMGYGAKGSGEWLGGTRDGGVDGVINEDVLGLDRIHLQAKRYATGRAINVEKVKAFAGTLAGRRVTKGVFVTTSYFTPDANKYAQGNPELVLIDGERLTRLLVEYGVAVRSERILELKKVDNDYFDNEED